MGHTALYRDLVPFRPARAEVSLDADAVILLMPDGRQRRHSLDRTESSLVDGFVLVRIVPRLQRRFVRMLVIEGRDECITLVTPPDRGAVAPNVVRVPEAPPEAAIIDELAHAALDSWLARRGRLAACAISDLAQLAAIATPQFAALIGEVAAQRALELVAAATGPLRGASDLETALQPLADAARDSARVAEALVAALAHLAGPRRRRR